MQSVINMRSVQISYSRLPYTVCRGKITLAKRQKTFFSSSKELLATYVSELCIKTDSRKPLHLDIKSHLLMILFLLQEPS